MLAGPVTAGTMVFGKAPVYFAIALLQSALIVTRGPSTRGPELLSGVVASVASRPRLAVLSGFAVTVLALAFAAAPPPAARLGRIVDPVSLA